MGEYLVSIVVVAAVSAIASALMPQRDEKLAKSVNFTLSLVVLLTVISPLGGLSEMLSLSVIGFGDEFELGDAEGKGWLEGTTADAVCDGIRLAIEQKFRISGGVRVEADVVWASGEVKVSDILVTLSGPSIFADGKGIKSYIEEYFNTKCEVKINGT